MTIRQSVVQPDPPALGFGLHPAGATELEQQAIDLAVRHPDLLGELLGGQGAAGREQVHEGKGAGEGLDLDVMRGGFVTDPHIS